MPKKLTSKEVPCPGHEDECPFCKQEKSISPFVGRFEVKREKRYCCSYCEKNDNYADGRRDKYGKKPTGISKI